MVPLEERFWAKVKKTDDCWLWTAATTSPRKSTPNIQYGVLGRGGRGTGNIRAHVYSYELHKGPVPEGLLVRHTCDNTRCVNPAHLILGTQTDNMRDASQRGRIRNQNTDKIVCDSGHSLADAIVSRGRRKCRECSRLSCIRYREKKANAVTVE